VRDQGGRRRNHSRAGGTEAAHHAETRRAWESLPRGRDGVGQRRAHGLALGITPARAGRRARAPAPRTPRWNHSRAGGTEASLGLRDDGKQESLPRGRDGAGRGRQRAARTGITPARAGRRPVPEPSPDVRRNHSRAGGTEPSRHRSSQGDLESLPRGRDGGFGDELAQGGGGITPARAGRSPAPSRGRRGRRNHSRAGGTETPPRR